MASQSKPQLFSILKPYKGFVAVLIGLTILSNGLNLIIPKIVAHGIDAYTSGTFAVNTIIAEFISVSVLIFIFSYLQSLMQVYTSERVARDMRNNLAEKISERSFSQLQTETPNKLLTNLTSDMNQVKVFVSQAMVSLISSVILIIGASILLLSINWKLGLAVLAILPLIAVVFFTVFSRMRPLFKRTQEIIDTLNKTINESILGAALIRVLNSQLPEYDKFIAVNTEARDTGLRILRLFATVIPIVSMIANLAMLVILLLGGHFVIAGTMSLGNFTAFNTYVGILIFPIIMIGFMSNVIARAQASYTRVYETLHMSEEKEEGTIDASLEGTLEVKDVTLVYGQKNTLKDVSFTVKNGTKTAIIGPTAAGKSQLLYLLIGLIQPTSGSILYDGHPLQKYTRDALHRQVGFVFQDSIIFNMSIRENIAFSSGVSDQDLEKAIETAELGDFIATLPEKLETVISERGTSLSGGQKQRVMLARALALNPRILLLDDFTARVDTNTEKKIIKNIERNYPGLTMISVTQKISSAEQFDKIIVLMEGEVLAEGNHDELMHSSPEYVQIFNSQRSTNAYELHT